MYSGESVYDGVYIRLLCNVFCKKIVVCRRFLASPKLCALLGRRYSILLFRNIREYSRIYSSIPFIYLKYLLNVNLLIFSVFPFFFHRENSFLEIVSRLCPPRSCLPLLRPVKRDVMLARYVSKTDVSRLWNFWKLPLSFVRQNTDFTPASLVFTRTTACTGLQERINSEMEASASCCRAKYQRLSLFIRNPPPCGAFVS